MLFGICFSVSLVSISFYLAFKFKTNKGFSFARTFPFETNKNTNAIKITFLCTFLFMICSVILYFSIYTNDFKNNYILLGAISASLICALFILLNIINLVSLKLHFFVFSLYAALITTLSVILGFHSIFLYKSSDDKIIYLVICVFFFIKAVVELLLISPLFKFSFLMDVKPDDGTLEKPKFIRLAFYEWLYLFLFIINTFILVIEKIA